MLYPMMNRYRNAMKLDGVWKFAKDEHNAGERNGWMFGIPADREIAIPASWNEQHQDLMYFFQTGWYEREDVYVPRRNDTDRYWLRVGAANYLTTVWVNGIEVGKHEGGHLPFCFEVTHAVQVDGFNKIVIAVDARITSDRLPPGDVEDEMIVGFKGQYPNNYYDFFPYGGINRSVWILSTPDTALSTIHVDTSVSENSGTVHVSVGVIGRAAACTLSLEEGHEIVCQLTENGYEGQLIVPNARLWCPEDPYLYSLCVRIVNQDGDILDEYTQSFGIRTVEIRGADLLLNGKPIFMTGFGMHEDFAVLGKGLSHAVIVKDFQLLRWVGANSLRTSHYPYSEEFLHYADRQGILVIGETPFVGFVRSHYTNEEIRGKAERVIAEMIERDRNHPSIIAWSLANEGDTAATESEAFFQGLYQCAKSLDQTRPVTIVNCVSLERDVALKHFDFICLNRYYGWYEQAGQLDAGCERLDKELDAWFAAYGKPIMVTEFGADAMAGVHTDPAELFSEEYQANMVTRQYDIILSKPYTIGAHVWTFADFKTSQTPSRVVVNRKGVFTRDRQPKLAAHRLRELWTKR